MINLVIRNIYKVNGIYNLGSRDCINKKDFAIKFAKKLTYIIKILDLSIQKNYLPLKGQL